VEGRLLDSLVTANTTAGGVELRNVRLSDIDLKAHIQQEAKKKAVAALDNVTIGWMEEKMPTMNVGINH